MGQDDQSGANKRGGADAQRPHEPSEALASPASAFADLLGARDSFIHTFFRKGAELTEELLREDERLRRRLADLEGENAALRAQVASAEAIRELLGKIEQLERDKRELLSQTASAREAGSGWAERFAEIESENAKLASLYVAGYQLHATLELPMVLRHIKELLAQLVGARAFAVYLADESATLVPVAVEGIPPSWLEKVASGQGAIGQAFARGASHWVDGDATQGTPSAPAAVIPLQLGGRPVGAIAVFATYEQKPAFVELDFELFSLLGAQAASALTAARLFAQHGARMAPIETLAELDRSEAERNAR
jgi:hypothetical protein